MNPWPILAALLLALGAGTLGYLKGGADNEARHTAAAREQAARDAAATADLAADEQLRRLAGQAMEDQANADPIAVPQCLSVDRVRWINLR